MKKFTKEETMLMMLYNPGSREGLIRELAGMKVQLAPEEKRLENRASEVFTNEVRNVDNGVYNYLTKVGDIFFHYHYRCGSVKYHTFNPNDYKIIPTP